MNEKHYDSEMCTTRAAFKCNFMQETDLEALLDTEVKSAALNQTECIQLEQYLGRDRYLLMIYDE